MKNWLIRICALGMILLGADLAREDLSQHLFNIHRLMESLHYWAAPLAAISGGVAHWHSPKHPVGRVPSRGEPATDLDATNDAGRAKLPLSPDQKP